MVKRKALAVLAQTLCATGVLILYAVTFACRGLYHFPFFGLVPTFLLMSLITVYATPIGLFGRLRTGAITQWKPER